MNEKGVHPAGFYPKYPEVTWDLAEERWLGYRFPNSRSDVLVGAVCLTCGWSPDPGETILVLVKRRQVTEVIIESQHWYQCPGDPRVKFWWLDEMSRGEEGEGSPPATSGLPSLRYGVITVTLTWCGAGPLLAPRRGIRDV